MMGGEIPSIRQSGAIVASGPITKPRSRADLCGTVRPRCANLPPLQAMMSRSSTREPQRRPRAAAELALQRLQPAQHLRRLYFAFDQRNAIGEIPSGAAMSRIEDDRRSVEQPELLVEPGDRGLDHAPRGGRSGRAAGWSRWRWHRGALRCDTPRSPTVKGMRFASPADRSPIPQAEAPRDCPLCPRLVAFRARVPGRVPGLVECAGAGVRRSRSLAGDRRARSGQAWRQPHWPAVHRRFRRRAALRDACSNSGWPKGEYGADPADGLTLKGAIILNAVKCLPPGEQARAERDCDLPQLFRGGACGACRMCECWLRSARSRTSPRLVRWVCRRRSTKFGHGAEAVAPDGRILLSSYHCSRYNQNTNRLNARCSRACSSGRWRSNVLD